jgi:hypothetical protein
MFKGSCLCGGVSFEVKGNLVGATSCHCGQCRKNSGHYWCSTPTADDTFTLTSSGALKWYASSENAKRGFCSDCGSFLFWKHSDEPEISISMAAFDTPTGLKLSKHIFVADKGDYYDITDGVAQFDTF